MDNNEQLMKGGGIFRWFNNLYNSLFGSIFGYTDTVQLGGKKTHRNQKRMNKTKKRKI